MFNLNINIRMNLLTKGILLNVCKKEKYIAIRGRDGYLIGFNCRCAFIEPNYTNLKNNSKEKTRFISYFPISFNEYLTIKIPFIKW